MSPPTPVNFPVWVTAPELLIVSRPPFVLIAPRAMVVELSDKAPPPVAILNPVDAILLVAVMDTVLGPVLPNVTPELKITS